MRDQGFYSWSRSGSSDRFSIGPSRSPDKSDIVPFSAISLPLVPVPMILAFWMQSDNPNCGRK